MRYHLPFSDRLNPLYRLGEAILFVPEPQFDSLTMRDSASDEKAWTL
jgi:hypothetical protein